MARRFGIDLIALLLALLWGAAAGAQTRNVPLEVNKLQLRKVKAEQVTFKGRQAIRLTDAGGFGAGDEGRVAIVAGTEFQDGTIEIELAGEPAAGAPGGARGFVGLAFRVAPEASKFECIYLRPTNARADDQVRRNHSVQYMSLPGFPWQRLRQEFPEKYETYVDLAPGEWTKVKVEVRGLQTRLYVHGAAQPALLVNDLKQGQTKGAIALWIGPGTLAHFANLRLAE